jgi:branched-chain amino acid transport system ATP-binding protein
MNLALMVENLAAGWGETKVLHEVSFAIPAGGSLALLGRNGVGKSTLLTRDHGIVPAAGRGNSP